MSRTPWSPGQGEGMESAEGYGCLFCRSGSEERIIRELGLSHPTMSCLSPKRVRIRRQGEKELASLFPGYIFFHLARHIDFRTIVQKTDI